MKHYTLDVNKLNTLAQLSLKEEPRNLYWAINMAKINWWLNHHEELLIALDEVSEDTGYNTDDLLDAICETVDDYGCSYDEAFVSTAIIAYEQDL